MVAKDPRGEYDDLMGIDLQGLDLDHIVLEEEKPPSTRWAKLVPVVLLALSGTLLWLPDSLFYSSNDYTNGVFFTATTAAVVVGVFLGRWLWKWGQEAAARWAESHPAEPSPIPEAPSPPSKLNRWLTLFAAVGGAIIIVFVIPGSEGDVSGAGLGTSWFLTTVGAIVVGIMAGRWLLMQEHVEVEDLSSLTSFELPPWFKWVTLGALVLTGLFLSFGAEAMGLVDDPTDFSLGGVAFLVGIVAAIWLVRRFDEVEESIRADVKRDETLSAPPPKAALSDRKDNLFRDLH